MARSLYVFGRPAVPGEQHVLFTPIVLTGILLAACPNPTSFRLLRRTVGVRDGSDSAVTRPGCRRLVCLRKRKGTRSLGGCIRLMPEPSGFTSVQKPLRLARWPKDHSTAP